MSYSHCSFFSSHNLRSPYVQDWKVQHHKNKYHLRIEQANKAMHASFYDKPQLLLLQTLLEYYLNMPYSHPTSAKK